MNEMATEIIFTSVLATIIGLLVGFSFFRDYPDQWMRRVQLPLMTPAITAMMWLIWHMGKP